MTIVTEAFTSVRAGGGLLVRSGQSFTYTVTGAFTASWLVELTADGGLTYREIASGSGTQSAVRVFIDEDNNSDIVVRFRTISYTSGTMTGVLADSADIAEENGEFRDNDGIVRLEIVDGGINVYGFIGGGPTGLGDMESGTYDPGLIASDVFDMDNMVEGATTKILTDTERTDIANNKIHALGDGSDHSDVGLNNTHRLGDGSDHADVAANTLAISSLISGEKVKPDVDTSTTGLGNITLSGEQTLNGHTTLVSDVMVTEQTDGTKNGVYTTGAGAWIRRIDYNSDAEVNNGDIIHVNNATSTKHLYKHFLVTPDPITLEVTSLTFSEHADHGQATETLAGVAEIATQAESDAGTDDTTIITPLKLKNNSKLSGIEDLAEVNNISDPDALTLTDGSNADALHTHAGGGDVVGPASAVDDRIATFDTATGKLIQDGGSTIADVLARANHTGTQLASTISDFETEVRDNSSEVIFSEYKVGTTSDPTTSATTSGGAPTLAEMTHTFTPENANNRIEVHFSGQFENDDKKDDRGAYCGIFLDGNLETETERGTYLLHDDPQYPGHLSTMWMGKLPVAEVIIDVRFWGDDDDTIGKETDRCFYIKEIKE